jgi:hypothetical protein
MYAPARKPKSNSLSTQMLHFVHPAVEAALQMSKGAFNAIFNPPFKRQTLNPCAANVSARNVFSNADLKKKYIFCPSSYINIAHALYFALTRNTFGRVGPLFRLIQQNIM